MIRDRIINVYEIGDIVITEKAGREDTYFEVSLGHHTRGYPSLDMAIVGALALKYDGNNSQADRLICQMLNIGDRNIWK